MVGLNILAMFSTFFTTWLIVMYWSFTSQTPDEMAVLQQQNLSNNPAALDDLCQKREEPPRERLKRIFSISSVFKNKKADLLQYALIPRLARGKLNQARYQDSLQCVPVCRSSDQLILVTNVISLKEHYENLKYRGQKPGSNEIDARFMEILNTLQANLNHPQIKTVVALVESKKVAGILLTLDFDNSHKLLVQNFGKELTMPETFEYTTTCFKEETIVIANQDVIFGEGWATLDYEHLRDKKKVYALTRHGSKLNEGCTGNSRLGICGVDYSLSHDAFVMYVREKMNKSLFPTLRQRLYNIRGVENVVIWTLRHRLGYQVTNPCLILKVHHEHCMPIRNSLGSEKQGGNSDIWEGAEFTDTLY